MVDDSLTVQYASMETSELVMLHQSATLTEVAYPLLESELSRRNVPIGPRPAPAELPPELPFFSGHWTGLHSARSALVFVAGLVPALLALISYGAVVLAETFYPSASITRVLPIMLEAPIRVYLVFAFVAVWRCARNCETTLSMWWTRWKGLGLVLSYGLATLIFLRNAIVRLGDS